MKKLLFPLMLVGTMSLSFGQSGVLTNAILYHKDNDLGKAKMEIDKAMKKTPYKKIELVHKNVSIHKTMIDYLNRYSKRSHASMLVMFPETQNFFEKLFFSSITKQLSFNLKRPLLSIRKEKV